MENISVKIDKINDISELYRQFYKDTSDSTGTILVHHGKAKYPGKYVKDYSEIKLYEKTPEAEKVLKEKASEIFKKYNLNSLLAVHNIGTIYKNDPILFLAVEAKDRETGFKGMRELLEFIKSEKFLGLEEIK
ncbi:molybdenum cofactor biosynthesis protein MoaE [Flexistipes sp.]|uniref:molybdenum cofactor biosynthesis protein MoaE n=1 Tax=Flexistipes sp. TaxID=3088135 RepID=UPI002E1C6ADF|nr:molybdenum cofactor biosynthesis protein MoaE [Flexistipes sp.]